jgi:excisionase family DNA binding protein
MEKLTKEINNTQVYTREEAEILLQISQSTMRRLIKKGVIRAAKIGGQYRILGAEILRQFLPTPGYEAFRAVYRGGREVVHGLEAEIKAEELRLKEGDHNV